MDTAVEMPLREAMIRLTQHRAEGRFDQALCLVDELVDRHGPTPELVSARGATLCEVGRIESGLADLKAAAQDAPQSPEIQTDLGAMLARNGQIDAAEAPLLAALAADPDHAVAHSNLGGIMVLRKDYRRAIEHLSRALDLEPRFVDAATNLAHAYTGINQPDDAATALYRALSVEPNAPGLHLELARSLYRAERHDTARYHADQAIELSDNPGPALLIRAKIRAAQGKMDAASDDLLNAAQHPGTAFSAMMHLLKHRRTTQDAPEYRSLMSALQQTDRLDDTALRSLYMSAGKAFDDVGDYARAFENWKKGNALIGRDVVYDPSLSELQAARLEELAAPDLIARWNGAGLADVAPTFIVGLPRSGTTLMEQILSCHSEMEAGGELRAATQALGRNKPLHALLEERCALDRVTGDDFTYLGESYLAAARQSGVRTNRFTDKMPANYRYVGLLSCALPNARFIVMRRHPLDCILSNFSQDFGQNQPAAHSLDYLTGEYLNFSRLSEHWKSVLPEVVLEVAYEDLVADTEAEIRRVLDFLRLGFEPAVLEHTRAKRPVVTASVSQVREPVYGRSVGRWKNYADHLASQAKRLGITVDQQVRERRNDLARDRAE